jgi:hypothetical protein
LVGGGAERTVLRRVAAEREESNDQALAWLHRQHPCINEGIVSRLRSPLSPPSRNENTRPRY